MANVLIAYYSTFAHVYTLAQAVEAGAKSVSGAEVRLRRIPELVEARANLSKIPYYVHAQKAQEHVVEVTKDDLRWADGVAWGSPTRFGNVAAQVQQFWNTLSDIWQSGELEDKPAGIFTSSATIHGGQETTIVSGMLPLIHLGMVFVGTPYGENPQILSASEAIGGSPYGPSTLAGPDGSLQPKEADLQTARNLGSRIALMAGALRPVRRLVRHGQQPKEPAFAQE
jgi:NAD(P)H dehydrogenase (quinone)